MRLCPNCGGENPDRFRLCGYCGTQLAVAEAAPEVRRTVTVVFSDLKGSTTLGERLDSESLREVLNAYFGKMRQALERHGGTVEKYIGDAIMAVFGIPRAHEDDALRAVRAAADMQRALREVNEELGRRWGVTLANRTGINTGEVVVGDVTSGQRLVTGDTVNVAARLEQAAPEAEVLLGESTYRLVRDAVEVDPLEPLELKGKAERVPAYRLLSVRGDQAIPRRLDAPMVGRERELAFLRGTFERVSTRRQCELVTVIGDAGVGKSRLIQEFVESVGPTATVLRGRCLSYGEGITFWPLAEVVRQAAGIGPEDSPDGARRKLGGLPVPDDGGVVERIEAAIGLSAETFSVEETFWAFRKLFEALAERSPLVLAVEDIHWAERSLLDLLEYVVGSSRDVPLLVLCSARSELLEEHPNWGQERENAHRIVLSPLSREESGRIVENLLGTASLPEALLERILHAAEGNPLFVEQLLSMLVDEGLVARGPDGTWSAGGDLTSFAVPPTISALLAARLDRLAVEERTVAERASVIGDLFYRGAVTALSPEPLRPAVGAHLSSLSRKQLIRPDRSDLAGEEAFRFHHVLIRDAAYQGLLKRTRIELHEAFAEWLEGAAGSLIEQEEVVAGHLEAAYRYRTELGPIDEAGRAVGDRAARLLAAAGKRAFVRGDMPAAANLLERAVALLPEAHPNRLALLPDLGEALRDVGEFSRAEQALEEAVRGAARTGDRRLEMDARVVRMLLRYTAEATSWVADVLEEAKQAIPVLEQAGDDAALARAWRLVGLAQGTVGRYREAEEAILRAIEHARAAGNRRQEARNLSLYATAALYGPLPVPEAIARCERLLGQATGDQRAEALVALALSQLYGMLGRFEEARHLYRTSRATLEDLGERVLAASTSMDSGRVEMMAGDPEAAERELRRDYEALRSMGEKYFLSTAAGLLAHALYLQERYDESEAFSRVSEETSEDDVESQALWRRARAKCLARRGRFDDAEQLAREAVRLIEQTESPSLLAGTLLDLAEVLGLGGKTEEAAPLVTRAVGLFEEKGNLVGAGRSRRVLEELVGRRVAPVAPDRGRAPWVEPL